MDRISRVLLLSSLSLAGFACHAPISARDHPLSFRAEVPKGTEGAIECDYLENINRSVWFGEAHSFPLQEILLYHGDEGRSEIFFTIVEEKEEEFGDFTESISSGRMAIEIGGRIIQAKAVSGRLPSFGIIDGGFTGLDRKEAARLADILQSSIDVEKQ